MPRGRAPPSLFNFLHYNLASRAFNNPWPRALLCKPLHLSLTTARAGNRNPLHTYLPTAQHRPPNSTYIPSPFVPHDFLPPSVAPQDRDVMVRSASVAREWPDRDNPCGGFDRRRGVDDGLLSLLGGWGITYTTRWVGMGGRWDMHVDVFSPFCSLSILRCRLSFPPFPLSGFALVFISDLVRKMIFFFFSYESSVAPVHLSTQSRSRAT